MRSDLVDRGEARAEPAARGAQVDPPDADAMLAGEPDGFVETILQARQPVGQGLGVVGGEPLDVLGGESGTLERRQDPR